MDEVQKHAKIHLNCCLGDVKGKFPVGFFSEKKKYKKGPIPNPADADIRASVTLGDVLIS